MWQRVQGPRGSAPPLRGTLAPGFGGLLGLLPGSCLGSCLRYPGSFHLQPAAAHQATSLCAVSETSGTAAGAWWDGDLGVCTTA